MSKEYISIQEASELSQKSIQTIRRAIKAKKLIIKRRKTPQGFNYLVSFPSLAGFYGLKIENEKKEEKAEQANPQEVKMEQHNPVQAESVMIKADDFRAFAHTMENLISQHHEERKSFLGLVNTLQEKIFVLENQINLLKVGSDKRWFQIWK